MVVIKHPNGKYHLDDTLRANLNVLAKNLRRDFDCFIVVTGRERYGKSTIADQVAFYLDPTYNIDRCVFTPEQFHHAVENARKYQAIVFDEAHGALNAKESMTSINKKLTQTFTEMGFRNLIIILVLPSFFELGKYAAIHRSNCLLHVYERGKFLFFSHKRKKRMYISGKKFYALKERANFKGKFTKFFGLDRNEYDNKKKQSTTVVNMISDKEMRWIEERNLLIKELYNNKVMNQEEIGKRINKSGQQISRILKEMANFHPYTDTIILTNGSDQGNYPDTKEEKVIKNAIQ